MDFGLYELVAVKKMIAYINYIKKADKVKIYIMLLILLILLRTHLIL